VRNARDAGRVRTPVVRGARRREPSPVPERVPVDARRAGESRAWASPGRCPSCRASPVRERVPVNTRHLPSPGPTYACSRRRQPLCCEHIFACTPWRFMNARSAARLRRIVGPLSPRNAGAEPSGQPGSRVEQTQRSDRIPRRRPPERENTVSGVNSSPITERKIFRMEKIRYRVSTLHT